MSRLVIESSNPNDSEADIEDKLEKAVRSVQLSAPRTRGDDPNKVYVSGYIPLCSPHTRG
jgi:hypothetical protein